MPRRLLMAANKSGATGREFFVSGGGSDTTGDGSSAGP